jgi:glycerol uptake facilitator-like aquaporin
MTLSRRIVAECLGTAFLLAAVIGSGIMGEKLAGGNIALALLANTVANPAVTLARAFTDTFAGIRPADAPGFVIAQFLGAFAATVLFRWLVPSLPLEAKEVVYPHTHAGRQ